MPKIPTYTSTAQLTAQSPEIKTQFQVPLTGGAAGTITTGLEKINEFYVAKQNLQDTVEAKKKYYEIKGTTDTFFERQKNNYNEDDAIQNYTKDFNEYTKLELAKVTNGDVRQKLKQELDLEFGQGVLKIKKNSFDALEKEAASIYNTGQTTDVASYELSAGNPLEQYKFKDQVIRRAEEYGTQFKLSDIDKQLKVNAAKATLFLSDVKSQVMNSEDPTNSFKQLYENNNAQTFIKDTDLTKLLVETYKNKISNMAVKGDPNSDYTAAVNLADQVEKLTKPDGTKIITDKNLLEWNKFKENIYSEKVNHDDLKDKAMQSADVNTYVQGQKDRVEGAFVNKFTSSTDIESVAGRQKAIDANNEYTQVLQDWLSANKNKSAVEKKNYSTELANRIIDKYNDLDIKKVNAYDSKNNKINYHYLFDELQTLKENYKTDPVAEKGLASQAKLFGYVDKKGNADVNSFLRDYIPILQQRLQNQ